MVQTKRLAALLLTLLALLPVPAALADSGIVNGTTVSGTVRVYLSSIASLTAVDVTVDGSYSIDGDASRAVGRGTRLKIANSGGTLTLSMNGQTQTMGSRFKLRRHRTSGNNGVYIAQARKPQSLYPGDIEFIAKGGNVQIVVHVYMEDYMRGVLPYEMDNSFPLEALKAQAVAARTYALKKMSAQASTYDVVDTTSDQVYNGTPTGNERCVQAVQETSGIVGTVNGEYMASYYTASNGGQTESVANAWGSGAYSYLTIKDDPYDLNNSASIAKSVTLYFDGTTSVSALTELLRTEAAALIGANSVTITGITGVYPHTPRYGEPSRVYNKVDIGLTVAGYGDVTVTLDYFDQIESLCGLSINSMRNETLTVTQMANGFKLTARRYGHGVGMSQRGAQQMAREGMTYDQILQFYYPGLVRTRYTMTQTLLPPIDGTQNGGADNVPEDTTGGGSAPVVDAKTAVVTLKNPLDWLNLRQGPSTTSAILATMPHGTQVTLLERGGAWSRVQYGTLSGYAKNEYIRIQDETGDEKPEEGAGSESETGIGTAVVALADESQMLNLRAAPTVNAAVLSRLRHGQTLTVLERYERWTRVKHGALTGYVSNDYIIFDETPQQPEPPQTTPAPPAEKRTAFVLPESGLNLRAHARPDSGILMTLPQGTMLSVLGEEENGMLPVALGDLKGYVASQYVFVATEEMLNHNTPTPVPTAVPTPVPTAAPTAVPPPSQPVTGRTATVIAESGLKLRAGANTSSDVLAILAYGVEVVVTGEATNGFYPVRIGTLSGYASANYLRLGGGSGQEMPKPTAAPTAVPDVGTYRVVVESANGLNLRAAPNTGSEVIYVLPYGMVLTVLGEGENGFLHVQWANYTGYVSGAFVKPFGAQ